MVPSATAKAADVVAVAVVVVVVAAADVVAAAVVVDVVDVAAVAAVVVEVAVVDVVVVVVEVAVVVAVVVEVSSAQQVVPHRAASSRQASTCALLEALMVVLFSVAHCPRQCSSPTLCKSSQHPRVLFSKGQTVNAATPPVGWLQLQ